MGTWGGERYLIADVYLAHHVGQDDRPARLSRGTATAAIQVPLFSAKMSQNEAKWGARGVTRALFEIQIAHTALS